MEKRGKIVVSWAFHFLYEFGSTYFTGQAQNVNAVFGNTHEEFWLETPPEFIYFRHIIQELLSESRISEKEFPEQMSIVMSLYNSIAKLSDEAIGILETEEYEEVFVEE